MKATSEQQLARLANDVLPLLRAVVEGFAYRTKRIGYVCSHEELPDERQIHVRMTLGDYRRARRLKHELERQPKGDGAK